MVSIVLDLAQVFVALLFVFFNNGSINADCGNIGGLISLASPIQTKICLEKLS